MSNFVFYFNQTLTFRNFLGAVVLTDQDWTEEEKFEIEKEIGKIGTGEKETVKEIETGNEIETEIERELEIDGQFKRSGHLEGMQLLEVLTGKEKCFSFFGIYLVSL